MILIDVLLVGILSKCVHAALHYPSDPYALSIEKNYIYERACYHHATVQSSKYESESVRSKVFEFHYHGCLSTVWPGCEIVKTDEAFVMLTSHMTFEKGNEIIYGNVAPIEYARKRGFFVENLLKPEHRCFIFWHPLEPLTDVTTFYKLGLCDNRTLSMMRVTEIVGTIKKFSNAGVEAPDVLYLKENLTAEKYRLVMKFEELAKNVKGYLRVFEGIGWLSRPSQELTADLKKCLAMLGIPDGALALTIFHRTIPTERIQLMYPFYTPIGSRFAIALHYEPGRMLPVTRTRDMFGRTFIAAAFDVHGNSVDAKFKDIVSYLVVSFNSIDCSKVTFLRGSLAEWEMHWMDTIPQPHLTK